LEDTSRWLRLKELCRELGISRQAVSARVKKGTIAWKQTRFYRLYDLESVKERRGESGERRGDELTEGGQEGRGER